jgi:hypothetical protein
MRCITSSEVTELFGKDGFSVISNRELWRFGLALDDKIHVRQKRVSGHPSTEVDRLADFAEALNRWLPTGRRRLLWLSHWGEVRRGDRELFDAVRRGLGEHRPIVDAPGHYFDAHDYDDQDQTGMSREQWRDVGLIVGLTSIVMINGWDAWLIAEGCKDRIEFWEGNLFLYSSDKERLARAEELLKGFNCSPDLV